MQDILAWSVKIYFLLGVKTPGLGELFLLLLLLLVMCCIYCPAHRMTKTSLLTFSIYYM